MKCSHCNGECCYLEKREGTTRYSQLQSHGNGVHFCKHCNDGTEEVYPVSKRVSDFMSINNLTLIACFPVLWKGWELDSEWFLCQNQSEGKVIVATDHGNPYIASAEELKEKISEYKEVIDTTESILSQLG